MTSREFAEWMAYWRIEPWGALQEDHRAGLICSTLCNIHRKQGQKPFVPEDFTGRGDRKPMDGEQIVAHVTSVLRGLKKGQADGADR